MFYILPSFHILANHYLIELSDIPLIVHRTERLRYFRLGSSSVIGSLELTQLDPSCFSFIGITQQINNKHI